MRILLIILLACFTLVGVSQTNPASINETLLKGSSFSYTFFTPNAVIIDNGAALSGIENPDQNNVVYTFDADEVGEFTSVIKYQEGSDFFYTSMNFTVVESIITVQRDFVETNQNTATTIDVLSNDSSSDGILNLNSIPYVQHGAAFITGTNIVFTPDTDFSGLAYFSYVVEDGSGYNNVEEVTINVISDEVSTSSDYYVLTNSVFDIVLPTGSTLSESTLGKIESRQSGIFQYSSNSLAGTEELEVSNGGNPYNITIHVLPNLENSGFVRDDYFTIRSGVAIELDVLSNDLEKNFPIVGKSPELKISGDGKFTYASESGFEGIKTFYYDVSDGNKIHRGEIKVVVSNALPESKMYEFTTRKNTAFVIDHNQGLEGLTVTFPQNPVHGTVRLPENIYNNGCGGWTGSDIIYEPNQGYVGQDNFLIKICAQDGSCSESEIMMYVVDASDDCNCIGTDCVWPGDANGDGRVSVADLLPIGYYLGQQGAERSEQGESWNALEGDNWGETISSTGVDIKNADSNGDGVIDVEDVDALDMNYEGTSSLVGTENLAIKDVPFYAVGSSESGSAGDVITIDFFVGSEDQPLLESQGLALSFNIPDEYVDGENIDFQFTPEKWYGYNNPTLSLVKSPFAGRIEASISRTGQSATNGIGQIGTVGIVLKEDIDQIKPVGEKLPIEIEINGGQYLNSFGESYALAGSTLTVYLDIEDQTEEARQIEIVTYPNPASEKVTFHANNQDEIQSINLYNALGQSLGSYKNVATNHFVLDVSDLPQGFYMAQVETLLGVSTEKVQIIRE